MKGTPSLFLWILPSFVWTCCLLEKLFLCKLFPQLCGSFEPRSDSLHFFPTLNLTIISKKPVKGNIEIFMIKTASFNCRIKLKLLFECVSFQGLEETGKNQVFSHIYCDEQ